MSRRRLVRRDSLLPVQDSPCCYYLSALSHVLDQAWRYYSSIRLRMVHCKRQYYLLPYLLSMYTLWKSD